MLLWALLFAALVGFVIQRWWATVAASAAWLTYNWWLDSTNRVVRLEDNLHAWAAIVTTAMVIAATLVGIVARRGARRLRLP